MNLPGRDFPSYGLFRLGELSAQRKRNLQSRASFDTGLPEG